ncbi:MAG: hypothetical protein O7C58_05765, partial [Rickettsia endosymbiont of Ixodes persulcatus]|nr:hypothetical protein [Rickettsia endosymbiont of Ixodes persulcatus]
SKSEDKKENKSSDKENKKEGKTSKKEKEKSDKKESGDKEEKPVEAVANEEPQSQEEAPVVEEQPVQQEPTDQEKMEANAKVAKEHGYTGIPNGDVGMLDENMPAEEQEQRAKELDEYARQHGGDDMDPFE